MGYSVTSLGNILEKHDGPVSVPEHAYTVLKNALLEGRLSPGDTLIQEEIAASLGSSRVPIREALKRLEGEGLVVQRPRRGYVVASLNADEAEDVFDVRMLLEERAGFLATQKRTQADVDSVRKAMDEMVAIQSKGYCQSCIPRQAVRAMQSSAPIAHVEPTAGSRDALCSNRR